MNDLAIDTTTKPQSSHYNGSSTLRVPSSGPWGNWVEDLELNWELNCLTGKDWSGVLPAADSASDSALVLTVTVSNLGDIVPRSLTGFTTSFRQYPNFEILRLDVTPASPAPVSPADDWRSPPPSLRLGSPARESSITNILDAHLQELDALKAQKKELKQLIEAKEQQLKAELEAHGENFQYDFSECDSLDCAIQAVSQRVESALKDVYFRITSQRWGQTALSGQSDTPLAASVEMHTSTSDPPSSVTSPIRIPSPAHFPWPEESETSSYGSYEKLPDERPSPRPYTQERRRRSPILAVLHFILVAFGLIALAGFIRRRCASLRTRTERAANREERRTRRAYRRAARRAAWKNWWNSGWGRRKDQERRLDYEEKRSLIQQQESRLEVAMEDEISNLRHAHGVVDELVRAEEGRGTLVRPVIIRGRMPGMASIAGVMMGQDVYSTSHLSGSTAVSETDDGSIVHTPPTSTTFSRSMSRSNSLPSYRTDPTQMSAPSSRFGDSEVDARSIFSDPPAYQTDPEDSDDDSHSGAMGANIVTDGFRQYAPSEYAPSLLSPTDTASIFTPESSIPDLSPRESAETVRTFM